MSTSTGDPTNPGTAAPQARLVRAAPQARLFAGHKPAVLPPEKKKKTIIIVTHRISTLKECDFIHEIKNGKLERVK